MGLFDRFFSTDSGPATPLPVIRFGRYNDTAKRAEQYAAWERALDLFGQRRYLDTYVAFLEFLRDEAEDNVHWEITDGQIHFRLYQGSELVRGRADARSLTAEARIARTRRLESSFLARLLTQNFALHYARFALDGDFLVIRFDTKAVDGSPHKLYAALRELSVQADKMDDLLLEEYDVLEPAEAMHLLALPDAEKEVKFQFLQTAVKRTLRQLQEDRQREQHQPGGAAYLLLALCYKLDYLLKPEGGTMDILERIHRTYLAQDDRPLEEKLQRLTDEFGALLDRSREDFFKEMYRGRSTFGITTAINHDALVHLLESELHGADWYAENGFPDVALAIPVYLVGHSLFSYALPAPDRDFFHLFLHILENDYFRALGYPQVFYRAEQGRFFPKEIRKAIKEVTARHRDTYIRLQPDTSRLYFEDPISFAKGYLDMVMHLDLTKQEG